MKLNIEITTVERNGRQWFRVTDTSYCPQRSASVYLFPTEEHLQQFIARETARKIKAEVFKAEYTKQKTAA